MADPGGGVLTPAQGGWSWTAGSFMAGLPAPTQGALMALGSQRGIASGVHILHEGDRGDHVAVVLRGYVKVSSAVGDTETVLALRLPGDLVGETAHLTGRPRTATVSAAGPVIAHFVVRPNFERFLQAYPAASVRLASMMSERLLWANTRRAQTSAYPAEVRLARLLADLANRCGRTTEHGILVDAPLSQEELGTMVGIAPVTAQKAIGELKRLGLIQPGYRRFTVLDLPRLAALE
jgi:CRP/FNR family cyclic AMP-dependent transcriptional regulator